MFLYTNIIIVIQRHRILKKSMTNKSKIAKAGLGLLAGVVMFAGVTVSAMTQSQAQALVASLNITGSAATALVAALTTDTTSTTQTTGNGSCLTFSKTLAMGVNDSDVMNLQKLLNSDPDTKLAVAAGSVGSAGNEGNHFGPATKAALIKWQTKHNISHTGFFGNLTKAAANAMCTTTTTTTTTTTNTNTTTNTTVVVSANAKAGQLQVMAGMMPALTSMVPAGANSVKVGEFTFVAPSDMSATLAAVTIHRSGVGAITDISNAYLYNGANRLTSGRTFNSSTNDATFAVNLNMAAGTQVTLSLYVNISTGETLAGSHQFSLVSASSVSASTGPVIMGNFPITTNMLNLSAVTAGTLSIQKNGTLSNPHVGDVQAEVSEFQLSVSNEDALVNQITLTQGGSIANSALSNFTLKQNGTTISTASMIDSKGRLTFVINPGFAIMKGNNRVFQVFADIAGRPNDTISFYVDEAVDTLATGQSYYSGMTSSINANFDQSSDTGLTLTLQGGQFSINFTGPSSANISNTSNDVTLWAGSLYTANSVEVRHWHLQLADSNGNLCESSTVCDIQDIKIWNADNNTVIAGPKEITDSSGVTVDTGTVSAATALATFTFNDTYTLSAGSVTHIKVTVDVKNNPTNAIALKVTFGDGTNSFSSNDLKNVDSNTYLTQTTDVSPSGTIAGNTQSVVSAGLTVNASASPTDNTIVKGASNVPVTAFDFVVGSGDSVKISTIVLTGGVSDTNDNSYGAAGAADGSSTTLNNLVSSAKLWVDANGNGVMDAGEQLGTTKSFSSGIATFDNLNWTLPASQTKKVLVSITTNSAASLNGSSDFLRFSIESTGVTANDSQGNSITSVTGIPANSAEAASDVVITVSAGGTLTGALAANPTNPASGLMYGGSTMRSFAAFKLSAQNDAFYAKKFILSPYVNGSASSSANARISNLQVRYKNEAGTTVTQTIGLSGTTTNVDISANPMFVPANGDATLEVIGDLSMFTNLDGTEDANITFGLQSSDTSSATQYTGKGSNSDLTLPLLATNLVGNAQYVYRTNLAVSKNTAAGVEITGTKSRSSSQIVASYTYASTGGGTSSYFRGSLKAADSAATGWNLTGGGSTSTITTAGNFVSGSSAITNTAGTASTAGTLYYDFGASAGLNNYNRVAAWVKITSATSTTVTLTSGTSTAMAQGSSAVTFTTGVWTYVDIPTSNLSVTSGTEFVGFTWTAANAGTVAVIVDDLRFYNDSQIVTVAGAVATTTAHALPFLLKDSGGTVRMYGAYNKTAGTVVLIPGDGADVSTATTYSQVEVAGGSSLNLDLWTNTNTLMNADTTANEVLSVSTQTGTPSSAGNFLWYDNSDSAGGNNMAGISVVNPISSTLDFSNNY